MIKFFMVLKRKTDLTREQFLQHWKEIHGPLFISKNVPGLRRYVQNHAVKVTEPGFETGIDGIAQFWFDDIELAQAFLQWLRSSSEAKDLREDIRLFTNYKEGFNFLAEEQVLKEY